MHTLFYFILFINLLLLQANGKESFEELQVLFEEMFQRDGMSFGSTSQTSNSHFQAPKYPASASDISSSSSNNKRNCSDMSSGEANSNGLSSSDFSCLEGGRGFCLGVSIS